MSAAIAGLATLPSSDVDRASPRFALPLKDEAAELEESALLKVSAQNVAVLAAASLSMPLMATLMPKINLCPVSRWLSPNTLPSIWRI